MSKLKAEGEIEFVCKPHQLYNSLIRGIPTNFGLAEVKRRFNEPEAARGFEQQAEYQVSLLKTLFGVDYENLVSRGDLT